MSNENSIENEIAIYLTCYLALILQVNIHNIPIQICLLHDHCMNRSFASIHNKWWSVTTIRHPPALNTVSQDDSYSNT